MNDARSMPMTLALIASFAIHAVIVLGFVRSSVVNPAAAHELQAPPQRAPDPWRLGIERSQSTAIAWIGYDTYRAMNAPQGTIDQAGLTTGSPSAEIQPAPPASPSPPTEQINEAARVVAQVQSELARAAARATELTKALRGTFRLPRPSSGGVGSDHQRADEMPAAEVTPGSPPPAPNSGAPASTPADPGEQSDREAPPTTTLPDAEADDLGSPLAAQGLVIQTVRPRFSHYMSLTANPKDPLVRIHFDREGRVRWVDLVESTGYQGVDEPIKAAVYRWRAKGEALQSLPAEKPEAVHIVELRILL